MIWAISSGSIAAVDEGVEGNVKLFVDAADGLGEGDLVREMRRTRSCAVRCPSGVLLQDVVRVAALVTARRGRASAQVAASEAAVAGSSGCAGSGASSGVVVVVYHRLSEM